MFYTSKSFTNRLALEEVVKKLKRKILSNQKRYKLPPESELPKIEKRCVEVDNYLKAKGKQNLRAAKRLRYFSGARCH